MKKIIITFFSVLIISLSCITNINAEELDLTPNSKSSILIEFNTGEVLYEKNKDEKLPPASMTKIASLLLIFENIDNKNISINDVVNISENASKMGGSQLFLQTGESYKVEELIKGVAIASGNDAVVALAEYIAGTEANFVKQMNDKCKELGCKNTNFVNPHGLDDENHYTTAYDMSLLARELLKYKDILNYTSLYEDYLKRNDGSKTWLVNTNKLIRYYIGVDGLKTGYTKNAGYCLTSTANKNNMRLISVVMGSNTNEDRSRETINLLDFGYNNYKSFLIKSTDEIIGNEKVYNSKKENINLYLKDNAFDLRNIIEKKEEYDIKLKVNKLNAPIKKNSVVGKVTITNSKKEIINTIDIIIKEDIKKASLLDYIIINFKKVLNGK